MTPKNITNLARVIHIYILNCVVDVCPKGKKGAEFPLAALKGLEVRLLQQRMFGKSPIDSSMKHRHLLNFDLSLKGRKNFLQR